MSGTANPGKGPCLGSTYALLEKLLLLFGLMSMMCLLSNCLLNSYVYAHRLVMLSAFALQSTFLQWSLVNTETHNWLKH